MIGYKKIRAIISATVFKPHCRLSGNSYPQRGQIPSTGSISTAQEGHSLFAICALGFFYHETGTGL